MKKSLLAIYAAPVALLLMAGGLAMPTASADPNRIVRGVFTYDRHASAETIYASLQHRAEDLCAVHGNRNAYMRQRVDTCVASVVASGVTRIGRADLAARHGKVEKG